MYKLMSYMEKNVSFDFYPTGDDSYKKFRKTLKKPTLDWIYKTKEIKYNHNSLGFREKELDLVDWNNSIVMLGCSNVYGYSLAEEDTAARVLEKQIEIPVVNLGVTGGSVELAFYNSLILYEMGVRPKSIIQNWSCTERYNNFDKTDTTSEIQCSYVDPKDYALQVNWNTKSIFYRKAFNTIWKNKTFIYECSFFENTASEFDITLNEFTDVGRDLKHPGILSNKVLADRLTNLLMSVFK